VEREIARQLSLFFAELGLPEVKRIPTTGRTGPDIEINEFGLVVDVKSRLACPKSFFPVKGTLITAGEYTAMCISDLLPGEKAWVPGRPSKMVADWYSHMEAWTHKHYDDWKIKYGNTHYPSGITAVVLHRPGMPYGSSAMVLRRNALAYFGPRRTYHLEKMEKNK
jgi:hypothetical protein